MKVHSRSESVVNIPEKSYNEKEQPIGNNDIKQIKKKTIVIKEYLMDYTANSNLHGLRYIGEKERTSVEKIFWIFMFICSMISCSYLIRNLWINWNERPIIVSFAEKSTPVWQIPFPAITVCFETKSQQTKFNFTKYFHLYNNNSTRANLTTEELEIFEDLSSICYSHVAASIGRKISDGNKTVQNLIKVSPNIDEMFYMCWKGFKGRSCSDLFQPILTEAGLCYTFNTIGADQLFRIDNLNTDYSYLDNSNKKQSWTLENGYPPNTPLKTYPLRGSGYGAQKSLIVILKASKADLDNLCSGYVQGFKVLLHNPAEMPRLSQQYFRSPLSQEVVVAVKPKMMTTSEGLKPYDVTRRQCYFSSDRCLHYFKVYTQANCEMECLTNFTYARCGCVHFGMPHGPNIPVCNAGSFKCMDKAQKELATVEVQIDMKKDTNYNDTLDKARRVAAECKCLPACTSIEYEAETSQADFDLKALYKAMDFPIFKEEEDLLYTSLRIFFKEAQFITSKRSELYGITDFLANCGGLLGLFLGFSILSVAEILYFLTLRLYCMLQKRRQAKERANLNQNPTLAPQDEKLKSFFIF